MNEAAKIGQLLTKEGGRKMLRKAKIFVPAVWDAMGCFVPTFVGVISYLTGMYLGNKTDLGGFWIGWIKFLSGTLVIVSFLDGWNRYFNKKSLRKVEAIIEALMWVACVVVGLLVLSEALRLRAVLGNEDVRKDILHSASTFGGKFNMLCFILTFIWIPLSPIVEAMYYFGYPDNQDDPIAYAVGGYSRGAVVDLWPSRFEFTPGNIMKYGWKLFSLKGTKKDVPACIKILYYIFDELKRNMKFTGCKRNFVLPICIFLSILSIYISMNSSVSNLLNLEASGRMLRFNARLVERVKGLANPTADAISQLRTQLEGEAEFMPRNIFGAAVPGGYEPEWYRMLPKYLQKQGAV